MRLVVRPKGALVVVLVLVRRPGAPWCACRRLLVLVLVLVVGAPGGAPPGAPVGALVVVRFYPAFILKKCPIRFILLSFRPPPVENPTTPPLVVVDL